MRHAERAAYGERGLSLHDIHRSERRFVLALLLVCLTLVAETAGGLWTGSLALLSDAAHVFLDVLALAMSYAALRMSARPPMIATPMVSIDCRSWLRLPTAPHWCW